MKGYIENCSQKTASMNRKENLWQLKTHAKELTARYLKGQQLTQKKLT